MNINIAIEDLRNNLVNEINNSGLPIGVVELICKELYTKVQNQYIAYINSEYMKDAPSPEELTQEIQNVVNNDQKETMEVLNGRQAE